MTLVRLACLTTLLTWAPSLAALQATRSPGGAADGSGKLDASLVARLAFARPDEFLPVDVVLTEQSPTQWLGAAATIPARIERRELVIAFLKSTASATQRPLVDHLEAQRSQGRVRGPLQRLWIHNVIAAEMTVAAIRELAARPDVALVHYDPPRGDEVLARAAGVQTQTQGRNLPNCGLERIRAPEVWSRFRVTGRGVVVGVIDTGVCSHHPDLQGRFWKNPRERAGNGLDDDQNGFVDDVHGWNFRDENDDLEDADEQGHGSHVAGIVAGNGLGGVRSGVAPEAEIMTLKFFNDFAHEMSVWRAIEYGLDNGADVLTGSLGWPHGVNPARDVWRSVCENAIAGGAVVIFAVGNERCSTLFNNVRTPGDVPSVISVGAVDCRDVVAGFSSCGPSTWQNVPGYNDFPYPPGVTKPDVSAPGVNILSHRFCNGYRGLSGTSQATPHVAGLAALLLQADPSLDHFAVKALLEGTATDLGSPGKDNQSGAGRIDAFAAVERALANRLLSRR